MECDQLSVELRNKNENLKKFSAKVTRLEIQVIEAQAQSGVFDRKSSDPDQNAHLRVAGVSPNPTKNTVSGKLKSFFGNKLKGIVNSKETKKEKESPRLGGMKGRRRDANDEEEKEEKKDP